MAGGALLGWFGYDWKLGLMLLVLCGFVALFYGGALTGPTDEKVRKAFCWMILAMTLIAIGVVNQTDRGTEDSPRMCGRIEC